MRERRERERERDREREGILQEQKRGVVTGTSEAEMASEEHTYSILQKNGRCGE